MKVCKGNVYVCIESFGDTFEKVPKGLKLKIINTEKTENYIYQYSFEVVSEEFTNKFEKGIKGSLEYNVLEEKFKLVKKGKNKIKKL